MSADRYRATLDALREAKGLPPREARAHYDLSRVLFQNRFWHSRGMAYWKALFLLYDAPRGLYAYEIAERLGLKRGARTCAALEARGWATYDRKEQKHGLALITDLGRAYVEEILRRGTTREDVFRWKNATERRIALFAER